METKVQNMVSSNGNKVANQFIIRTEEGVFFQSYNTIVAKKDKRGQMYLDAEKWNYSRTTAKYRNVFTGLDTKETENHIKDGRILLVDLNS